MYLGKMGTSSHFLSAFTIFVKFLPHKNHMDITILGIESSCDDTSAAVIRDRTLLYEHFRNRTKVAFGIGTYISNDTDVPALNIVMKTTLCNGMDVAKISDTPGKGMCKNPDYVHYLKRCIDWRMNHDR